MGPGACVRKGAHTQEQWVGQVQVRGHSLKLSETIQQATSNTATHKTLLATTTLSTPLPVIRPLVYQHRLPPLHAA